MAAAASFRLLLVASLVFSHIILLNNAVPVTRTGSLMHGAQVHRFSENGNPEISDDTKLKNERMAVELNDYPGSGANNRHTPRPPFGRGCIDC